MAKVGLAYNLIDYSSLHDRPLDFAAELDSPEAIQAISNAIRAGGHKVILLEADHTFPARLKRQRPDIVFNIAEGTCGENREADVPAFCEMFGVPYTGSDVFTTSLCLNKARTNALLSCKGLKVPPFQVFTSGQDELRPDLEFPLIVKLLHEGSSMGLSKNSVVHDVISLKQQVDFLIDTYRQPALVQKFILGREFTVGVLGNENLNVLPITEVAFNDNDPFAIVLPELDTEVIPVYEQIFGKQFLKDYESQLFDRKGICPANIDADLASRICQAAVTAFRAVECRDWFRIDFRYGNDNGLYVLDLNPIAGIAPGYWLPKAAMVANIDYPGLINRIIDIALERINNHFH